MKSSRQPTPDEHDIAVRSTTDVGQGARQGAEPTRAFSSSSHTDRLLVTPRFKHIATEGAHFVATGKDGEKVLRCEDEPIHIPGAVQGFGLLIALDVQGLAVRIVSENSKTIIGYTPEQLFSLEDFTSLLPKEQIDIFLDHLEYVRTDADVVSNGPEVFSLSIPSPEQNELKLWCAMHINNRHPHLVICEFELEVDHENPLTPRDDDLEPDEPVDGTLGSEPSEEDWLASTRSASRPLRFLRDSRRQQSIGLATLEVSRIISQVQEQLAAQSSLQDLLDVLVGLVQDLTGFHRTMVYQFDQAWNGQVVTELLNPRVSKDLYKGLNFPSADIPEQARNLYKINKVRLLYDRRQETARLVCRNAEDLSNPLDLTHSYLRAMSPVHSQYLKNMAVRSSLSISITSSGELWGLITCHSYSSGGRRISFPTRSICRIIGDTTSRNVERLSYPSRPQMRKLISTVPTKQSPSGCITASSEDLLKLFQATFGFLIIRDETKMIGQLSGVGTSQEAMAVLQYLKRKRATTVMTSTNIETDLPDLHFPPGFQNIAGLLLLPLSSRGQDFIVFFRGSQIKEVKWAGNPHEKNIDSGHLTPRTSFKTWTQTVTGSTDWTEGQLETAGVLCMVYGKFIEVWRQKEAALQNSHITRLLLANSAHEVRTPLNAIINYLEIALEGDLDHETRENLSKSCSASKSLLYVISDLLDLTAVVEEAVTTQNETFDLRSVLQQTTDWFAKDAQRKEISYDFTMNNNPGLPEKIIGDARRLRQAISNIIANAIENTEEGGVRVDVTSGPLHDTKVVVEICVSDTGAGMHAQKVDAIAKEVSQVEVEDRNAFEDTTATARTALADSANAETALTIGLGLAVVARIVHNMRGQLRLKSEKDRGSRFVLVFPFDLPEPGSSQQAERSDSSAVFAERGREEAATSSDTEEEIVLIGSIDRSVDRKNHADNSLDLSVGGRSRSDLPGEGPENSDSRLMEAIRPSNQIDVSSSGESSHAPSAKGISSREDKDHSTEIVGSQDSPKDQSQNTEDTLGLQQPSPRTESVDVEGQAQPSGASSTMDAPDSSAVDTSSEAPAASQRTDHDSSNIGLSHSTDGMRVLVAEDDPINSKIIEKRLKKVGHEVHLTGNGEECAYNFREEKGCFDIILMDIQVRLIRIVAFTIESMLTTASDAHYGWLRLHQVNPLFRGVSHFRRRFAQRLKLTHEPRTNHCRLGFTS